MAITSNLSRTLPAWIYNLGSLAVDVTALDREEVWERMDIAMGDKAVRIPVFLVNEEQMDIVYPPQRRRVIDPQRVKNIPKDRLEDPDFNINQLEGEENEWAKYKKVVAAGVYTTLSCKQDKMEVLKAGSEGFQLLEEARKAYLEYAGPCIYLCGERIVSWAKSAGVPVELVLDKVYYHELGHALMDTYEGPSTDDPYHTIWGRVIEESAANWIAYSRFKGREACLVQKLISQQSAEYQGYLALYRLIPLSFPLGPAGHWNAIKALEIRQKLRAYFQANDHSAVLSLLVQRCPIEYLQYKWLPAWEQAIDQVYRGHWNLEDVINALRVQGIPLFPPFGWGEGMLPAQVLSWGGAQSVAAGHIELWKHYKHIRAPRDPEYLLYLEEWALYLLTAA